MKAPLYESSSGALYSYMAQRPEATRQADLYTFTLAGDLNGGEQLTYTTLDINVTVPYATPVTYYANQLYFDQKQNKSYNHQKVGLDVDQWQVIVSASPAATIGDVPILAALANQILFNATCTIDRCWFDIRESLSAPPLVGVVRIFSGPVAEVQVGRSNAIIIINDWRILMQTSMPRNVFGYLCRWQLYGAGCNLTQSAYAQNGTATADVANTSNVVPVSVAIPGGSGTYSLGMIEFTSGANQGEVRMIQTWAGGTAPPAIGFTVWDTNPSAIALTYNGPTYGGSLTAANGGLSMTYVETSPPVSQEGWPAHIMAVEGKTSGKYYFELTGTNWLDGSFAKCAFGLSTVFPFQGGNSSPCGGLFYQCNGEIITNGGSTSGYPSCGGSLTVGIAVDCNAQLIWFYVSGAWQGSASGADPGTGTNGISISALMALGPVFPAFQFGGTSSPTTTTANFGATAFTYTVPSGFTAGWTKTRDVFGSFLSDGGDPANSGVFEAAPPAGSKAVCQFNLAAAATVSEIDFIFYNSGTQSLKAVIYDNAGASISGDGTGPGNLLAVSSAISSFSQGYNTFSISPSVELAAGNYWLGLVTTGTATATALAAYEGTIPVANRVAHNSDSYTSPASPFGSFTQESWGPYPIVAAVSLATVASTFTLLSPFPNPIASGDAFTAYPGCAHTLAACDSFGNSDNFGGQDRVPPTEIAL